ncbi:TetR/AcrR family transcriptional regulator [Paracidovorax sp. MALMAid1276]|uniref:TetR/AcrR family transcriptional regulator n=1 Tax=Paracidovorax sp. MALMAid1276 TaxID=3411631 RepID=UPI003B992B60
MTVPVGAAPSNTAPGSPHPAPRRAARSDGEDTRARLLLVALQLFSERGFAQTSVRAIAEAAGTNVAAIAYHFGDKAGLYTATFYEPFGSGSELIPVFSDPALDLPQALHCYFAGFLEPLKHEGLVTQSLRLHVRELLDPTHVWPDLIERECRAPHLALLQVLGRHMGVTEVDDDLHQLAFSLAGLVMQLWTQRDPLLAVAPHLAGSGAVDLWVQRLTGFALSMVEGEKERRQKGTEREGAGPAQVRGTARSNKENKA